MQLSELKCSQNWAVKDLTVRVEVVQKAVISCKNGESAMLLALCDDGVNEGAGASTLWAFGLLLIILLRKVASV